MSYERWAKRMDDAVESSLASRTALPGQGRADVAPHVRPEPCREARGPPPARSLDRRRRRPLVPPFPSLPPLFLLLTSPRSAYMHVVRSVAGACDGCFSGGSLREAARSWGVAGDGARWWHRWRGERGRAGVVGVFVDEVVAAEVVPVCVELGPSSGILLRALDESLLLSLSLIFFSAAASICKVLHRRAFRALSPGRLRRFAFTNAQPSRCCIITLSIFSFFRPSWRTLSFPTHTPANYAHCSFIPHASLL